jgi:hypothetical protein
MLALLVFVYAPGFVVWEFVATSKWLDRRSRKRALWVFAGLVWPLIALYAIGQTVGALFSDVIQGP